MVRKGEYLERAVVIPSDTPLEGLFHRGSASPGLLIAPPHPLAGGSMESTLIAELAWAVTRRGHPTLRFNYRGVGASPGRFSEDLAYDDLLKAAHHLRACIAGGDESALPPLAVLGVGLGANLALRLSMAAPFSIPLLILIGGELPAAIPALRGELVVIDPKPHSLLDLGKIVAESVARERPLAATEGGSR